MGVHTRLQQRQRWRAQTLLEFLAGSLPRAPVLAILVPLFYWQYQWSKDEAKHLEYSVTVAGFSGLDPDSHRGHHAGSDL
jgi:hypothetical protein